MGVGCIFWSLLHLFKWSSVWIFFLPQGDNSNAHARQNDRHRIHGHPSPRVDEDGSASMGKAKNPLWCRAELNSLKIMNIAQAASIRVLRRGNASCPWVLRASSKGWWHRGAWHHRIGGSMVSRMYVFGSFFACVLWSLIELCEHFPGRKNSLRLWLQHLIEKCANRKTKGQSTGAWLQATRVTVMQKR